MRITRIRVTTLRFEYPQGAGFKFAGGYCNGRLSCLVQIETDVGIAGIGSVYSHPLLVKDIIERHLQPMLLGENPLEVEQLWDLCYRLTRWYGRKGAAVSALGGVDTALWDIRGKAADKPIYELLNASRNRIPAYASALLWKDDPLQLAEEAQRHLANGFRRMKMRLGRSYEYDAEAVDCVKACIGAHNDLIIEGNARYTVEQARRMAERYRQHRVFWFEEPFPPEQIDNYLALRPNLGLRLAAGENEFGLQGFRELVDQATVDILQPDASRCGGITECYRVGQLAAKHGLKVATHSWSDAVAVVANMHVIAALANGITVEIDQTGNGLVNHLLTEPLRVADGEIALPHKPGLGVELDEEAVAQFTVSDDAIPDGNYSDMVFGKAYLTSAPPYDSVSASRRKEN